MAVQNGLSNSGGPAIEAKDKSTAPPSAVNAIAGNTDQVPNAPSTEPKTDEKKPKKDKDEKKSNKDKDRKTKMVYSDDEISPEEKMAKLPRYAFNPDDKKESVLGDPMPPVAGLGTTDL